ncbi:MAG: copper chaperone PCu(A)C [Gammaproteobacteria bacterium]
MKSIFTLLLLTSLISNVHASESLQFEHSWIRLTPPVSKNSAGYFTVSNHSEQDITIKSITTSVAEKAELHNMTVVDGTMAMVHMPDFTIKAHQTIQFKPAGKHMMLMGLKKPLKSDQAIEVSFLLSDDTRQSVTFTVRRNGPKQEKSQQAKSHKHH